MKQIIKYLIVPLIIGLAIAYFGYYLTKEYVDLRYTISEKIPTKFVETSTTETVQQLVVKNNGNIPATKIIITIDGSIEDYDIRRNSVSDSVEIHRSKNHFEAIYPLLPPDAQFTLVFKTAGEGITRNDLIVKHNNGKALEALESGNEGIGFINYGFLTVNLYLLFVCVLYARNGAVENFISKGSYKEYYEYLSLKKPFYINHNKWDEIRREYIKSIGQIKFLRVYSAEELEGLNTYTILSHDKPKYITDDEWKLIVGYSSESFEDLFEYSIVKMSYDYLTMDQYFNIAKPKYYPESKWCRLMEFASDNFLKSQKLKNVMHLSLNNIVEELSREMPSVMLPDRWKKNVEFLKECYFGEIYDMILVGYKPIKKLSEIDLSLLNEEQQEKLKKLAYRIQLIEINNINSPSSAARFIEHGKPEWIENSDWEELEEKSKSYISLKVLTDKYDALLCVLQNIAKKLPIGDKPKIIDDEEWESFIKLENVISKVALKITKDQEILDSEKKDTNELKYKILKQLSIIDNILVEPESINKIEGYDNPFSTGNFENLKTISDLMIKTGQS
jgi:hypothetical protein